MIGLTRKARMPPQPVAVGADQALSTSLVFFGFKDPAFLEEFDQAEACRGSLCWAPAGWSSAAGQFPVDRRAAEPT